ncbi:MAG TPA: T9SS type A sorting domain-containing protein [Flavipsychrobacter sp.]|nr:T9SS type A sorting domain-containing protein [Flavipsychrobacter sp.]
MKKALILLMAVAASAASAQSSDPVQQAHNLLQSRHQVLQSLMPSNLASRGTAPEERVIGASTYDSTSTLTDSILLTYSNKRGSTFDYLNLEYDFFVNPYTGNPMYNQDGGHFLSPQIYCDTAILWIQKAHVLNLYEKTFSNYDVNNNLITYIDLFHDTVSTGKYLNTFDPKNNIAASYWFYPNGTTWDSAVKRFFMYDVSGRLLADSMLRKDSSGVWQLSGKNDYAYDSSGNVIETNTYEYIGFGTWFNLLGSIYTYNSSNQLLTAVTGIFGGYTIADTFAYTSGISYPTTFIEYTNFTGGAPQYTNKQYHLDALGMVDTCYVKNWDPAMGWVSQEGQMIVFSYDADNEPVQEKWYDYADTSYLSIPSTTEYYYYESLQSTDVQKIAAQDNFTIYPNPTINDLFIKRKDNSNNNTSSLVISIINASGQKMMTEGISSFNNTEAVSLSGFTPGTYWLLIQDGKGNVLHRQSIVKQ